MTEAEYLTDLKAGKAMRFEDLMAVINENFDHTPAAFQNGEVENAADENQGSAKLFCFAATHQLSKEETLRCFGQYYQQVLDTPDEETHANIRNFMVFGWDGVKFDSTVLKRKNED